MARMGFMIEGLGYSGISGGHAILGFNLNNSKVAYEWYGTGSSSVLAQATSKPFSIPDGDVLFNFSGMDVRMKVTGGIFLFGRTDFQFTISDGDVQLYDVAPDSPNHVIGVDVIGPVPGDFTLTPAQFNILGDRRTGIIIAQLGLDQPDTPPQIELDQPDNTPIQIELG